MTGPKGNSDFCLPETLNVPLGFASGNIEAKGKQNSMFPEGPVIKCFVIPPYSKIEKHGEKMICLTPLQAGALFAKFSGFQNQAVLLTNHDNNLILHCYQNKDST